MMDIYKFGPYGDVRISFAAKAKRDYISYGLLNSEDKLLIQLLCHAMIQLKSFSTNDLDSRMNGLNNSWNVKCHECDEYFTFERDNLGMENLVKKEAAFTCPIYDLVFEGEPVFSIQENISGEYEVIIM